MPKIRLDDLQDHLTLVTGSMTTRASHSGEMASHTSVSATSNCIAKTISLFDAEDSTDRAQRLSEDGAKRAW